MDVIREEEKLTPRERQLKDIFGFSFMHSQGNGDVNLQQHLLAYCTKKGVISEKELKDEIPYALKGITAPKNGHTERGKTPDSWEAMVNWKDAFAVYSDVKTESDEALLGKILWQISHRDLEYQRKGRPDRNPDLHRKPDDAHDEYASYLRRYAISGVPAGHPTYTQIYKSLGEFMQKYKDNILSNTIPENNPDFQKYTTLVTGKSIISFLNSLVTVWERSHSGFKFFETEIPQK